MTYFVVVGLLLFAFSAMYGITELELLRSIVLDCGLTEELKWGAPCYTFEGKNVLMLLALRNYCCISFFKGSLLRDNKSLLEKPGKHSQAARLFKFTNIEAIKKTMIIL